MSCSYIKGQEIDVTSVLTNYSNIILALSALKVSNVNDMVIVDMTIDRANSSWLTPGYTCSMATNYPSLIPNSQASVVLATAACKQFYARGSPNIDNYAIQITDVSRFHILRVRTWGGITLYGGGNSTISSSILNSLGHTLALTSTSMSTAQQLPYLLSSYWILSNNTISGLFGSGIYTDVVGAWIHHNYLYDLGNNGIFIGYSAGDTLVEYNYIRNASVMPTASYGSGGVYFYGLGWSMQRHVVRNNWIFSLMQQLRIS
mmetsp:Transcript_19196/g.26406  ORF Transcript_19196/g.26406 Transcript_19196/m.26406 type:complete len:260 (-) Transcript_19196:1035-1814(-)